MKEEIGHGIDLEGNGYTGFLENGVIRYYYDETGKELSHE